MIISALHFRLCFSFSSLIVFDICDDVELILCARLANASSLQPPNGLSVPRIGDNALCWRPLLVTNQLPTDSGIVRYALRVSSVSH